MSNVRINAFNELEEVPMEKQLSYIVESLEKTKQQTASGVEYWKARELMGILAYVDWTNFRKVINSAIDACNNAGILPNNHFREFTDMVEVGSGAKRNIENWYVTR